MGSSFDFAARVGRLEERIRGAGLDAFVVTAQDSIYYLTGATYKPLERPFFIIAYPDRKASLLVPKLEQEHMRKAKAFDRVEAYWDYPSKPGEGWPEKLADLLGGARRVGIEPSAKAEISGTLAFREVEVLALVEGLRLVKEGLEIEAIRRSSAYADRGMALMCANLYRGVTPLEMFSLARSLQTRILIDGNFDPLSTEILTACWPAPASAQPHAVPLMNDRVGAGPIQNMSFLRVLGYAAECERTVFVESPSREARDLFAEGPRGATARLRRDKAGRLGLRGRRRGQRLPPR